MLPRIWTRGKGLVTDRFILIAGGLMAITQGFSTFAYVEFGPRWEALVVARRIMPLEGWGVLFLLAGVFVMLASVCPARTHRWGYIALTGMASAWAAVYILGMPFALRPVENLTAGVVWAANALLWRAISGYVGQSPEVKYGST